jgi:hypothetical protein
MATREAIDKLILDWRVSPCWELEDTPGFEEHRDELLAARLKYEAKTAETSGHTEQNPIRGNAT